MLTEAQKWRAIARDAHNKDILPLGVSGFQRLKLHELRRWVDHQRYDIVHGGKVRTNWRQWRDSLVLRCLWLALEADQERRESAR